MLNLPNEINQLITRNRLFNLVKLISLSKDYRKYFMQPLFWTIVIDKPTKLHKFINYALNDTLISYPIEHIHYFYEILDNRKWQYCNMVMEGTLSINDFIDHYKTNHKSNKTIELFDIGYLFFDYHTDILNKFYEQFKTYKCISISECDDIELFKNKNHYTHIFLNNVVGYILPIYDIIQNMINIKTIISGIHCTRPQEKLNLDLLITRDLFTFDVDNFDIEQESQIKIKKLTLTETLCHPNIHLKDIPLSITMLNIKNSVMIQDNINILSNLQNLSFISFKIYPDNKYEIPIKTDVLNIILHHSYFVEFVDMTIDIPFAHRCVIHNNSNLDIMHITICSNSITELIMLDDACQNAFLDLPNCNMIKFPICYNKIKINSPVLNQLYFYFDSILDDDYMDYPYNIELNSTCLKKLDLSCFPLECTPNIKN
jgi:hypothetical protein